MLCKETGIVRFFTLSFIHHLCPFIHRLNLYYSPSLCIENWYNWKLYGSSSRWRFDITGAFFDYIEKMAFALVEHQILDAVISLSSSERAQTLHCTSVHIARMEHVLCMREESNSDLVMNHSLGHLWLSRQSRRPFRALASTHITVYNEVRAFYLKTLCNGLGYVLPKNPGNRIL